MDQPLYLWGVVGGEGIIEICFLTLPIRECRIEDLLFNLNIIIYGGIMSFSDLY
jgi:hypothetical protein